ncbi:RNA helicase [Phanerochaete sordida]|uniref:RNA helicase n=1 Tax=Phanerochaete sordida TaxID=48140 RepID=A0A9P3G1D6_9APHY|nr:RNA helicase [Phanerochaete sordida]
MPRVVWVTFHPSYEGQYEDTLELTFHKVIAGSRTAEQFVITRHIRAIVGSPEDHEQLKPKAPYVKARPKAAYQKPRRIVRVMRPPVWSHTKWKVALPEHKPPEDLVNAAFGRHPKAAIRPYLPSLSLNAYSQFFQALLWIEEEQLRLNLATYAKTGVELTPRYPEYDLQIEGLGEGRPSVIVGDLILVKHSGDQTDTWYEGCVHHITGISVRLRFNEKFNAFRGAKVDVRFVLNRLPDRRMHQAVSAPNNPPRLLFPGIEHIAPIRKPSDYQIQSISLVDRTLSQNREQLETIAAIVNRPPGSVPFIVYGPPGTGKTVTIVETIRQILAADPDARILACAPSNAAADIIAKRLAFNPLSPSELFRLNSYARTYKSLVDGAPVLTDFSLYNDNEIFAIPALEKLQSYRVIVCTCVSAGIPYGLGVKRGHFTHVFIDEAGQATEPMSMIPIKTLADNRTNVVLAGDIQQLNPIVHSPLARDLGLKRSYLQRLMDLPIYDENTGKGKTVTKLVKHFRSHPDILYFPNRHFYAGELLPCADPAVTHSLLKYERLPAKNFPIIFHGIVGKDQREESSPSFFNVDEVTVVKDYLLSLLDNRKLRITPADIGIIAPYHAQCQKILRVIPDKCKGVKVGSVEEFQGQERRVIIITTVRSSTDYIAHDMKHTLGFVADAKRFNVAITRARSLLIVVGNPRTLGLDPMWREWLNFVHQKGGWRGKELNWNPTDPVADGGYDERTRTEAEARAQEMIQRMRAQYLHNYEPLEEQDDDDEGAVDPQEYAGREAD